MVVPTPSISIKAQAQRIDMVVNSHCAQIPCGDIRFPQISRPYRVYSVLGIPLSAFRLDSQSRDSTH